MNVHYQYSDDVANDSIASGNIRFMRIFAEFPWREGVKNDSGVIEKVNFQCFGRYLFENLGNKANIIM